MPSLHFRQESFPWISRDLPSSLGACCLLRTEHLSHSARVARSTTAVCVPNLYCLSASHACFCFSLGFHDKDLRSHVPRARPHPSVMKAWRESGRGRKAFSSLDSSSWTQTPSISFVAIAASRRSLITFSYNQLQPAQTLPLILPDPG